MPYDRDVVEQRLMEEVQRAGAAFQLQDLRCRKCAQTASGHMGDRCACGGLLENTIAPPKHISKLQVFLNIAEHHSFELLRETVAWLLREGASE
jgi:DNA polymerase epsilon subunit 1